MQLTMIDALGRPMTVENLRRVVYNMPDKQGVEVEVAYAMYTVIGAGRKWEDAVPMVVFERLNPSVRLK